MTDEVRLTGLTGSHPLGALAAFGLLRCCEDMPGFQGAELRWTQESDWYAVLECTEPEGLVEALVQRQQHRPDSPEWNWADTLKTSRDDYLKAAADACQELAHGSRSYADFLCAFGCDISDREGEDVEPTAFYMTSGRQEFLKEARGIAQALATGISIGRRKKVPEEMFREALFGPWRYEDPQHSLGLDPATERLHALRAKSPTKEASEGVTAAVWLALEALPLFPCFVRGRKLATTSFVTQGQTWRDRVTYLTWPLWRTPLPMSVVRSLLALPELSRDQPQSRELRARGIDVVFRSERYKVKTQGAYYILRPAYPCVSASA